MKLIKSLLISLTIMAALVIGYAIPAFAQAPDPAATLVPDISDAPAAVAPIVDIVPATPVPDVTDVPDEYQPAPVIVEAPTDPAERAATVLQPAAIAASPAPATQLPPPPYDLDQLTPAVLAAAAASLLSLIFRYVPGASDWFQGLVPIYKQWFMLVLSLAFALAITLWNIAAVGSAEDNIVKLLFALFAALSSNQVTYQYIKYKPPQS